MPEIRAMHGSKLLGLLASLGPDEWGRLEEYLQSPYFNKKEGPLHLLRALRPAWPQFLPEKADKYLIWERAFPKRPASDQEIAAEMNQLTRLTESFLGLERYMEDKRLCELHELDALARKKLPKNYRQQLKRVNRALDGEKLMGEYHYFLRYQVANLEVRHMLDSQVRAYDSNLQQLVSSLDDFYLIARLRSTCEMINRQFILGGHYDDGLANELLAYLKGVAAQRAPLVNAFSIVLQLLTGQGDLQHFRSLAKLLEEMVDGIEGGEWQELFSYAQNFCIRRVRAGESSYLTELFSLYKLGLDSGNMLDHGQLSPWKYKNVASVALRLQEFTWVQAFMHDYKEKLPPEFQENAFAFAQADLHYHKKEYQQALRTLSKVEFTDVFYSLDTRKMMLMIYFEQGETEALLSLGAAFKTYLKRNALISENNRLAYSHLVQFVLAICRSQNEPKKLARIKEEIDKKRPLVEEEWLMEKCVQGYAGYA